MNEESINKIIIDGPSGIKTVRIHKSISKFDPGKGIISEVEKGKIYVPEQGIIMVHNEKEIVLPCGHSASLGIGHVCNSGHLICLQCAQRYILVCIYPGCFRKLCTVPGCRDCARAVNSAYACRSHHLPMLLLISARTVFTGRDRTDTWLMTLANNKGYNLQIHERVSNGRINEGNRRNSSQESFRAFRAPEEERHA
ncbi:MAG: hypothetical protein Q8L26_08445 [Candidatus Omnitrophota bacterium]|nr:hypothetical protein [Candidatus Omnitrophota bacterium]